jgi:hypothetical protein
MSIFVVDIKCDVVSCDGCLENTESTTNSRSYFHYLLKPFTCFGIIT